MCPVKKVFLEISQNSPENTCARVCFLIKLQACELCEISKNPFLTEPLRWCLLDIKELRFEVKLSSKLGQEQKNLISALELFLNDAITIALFLEWRLGTTHLVVLSFKFQSFKLLEKPRGNLYTMYFIIII